MAVFGRSRDLKTKPPKTQAACNFLRWNKCQRVECIQMQKLTYGFVVICITLKRNDAIQFWWRHSFFDNVSFNKPTGQFLHLNPLYPLAFVPSKKVASCLSLRSFCFQLTRLAKYGHSYLKGWQAPMEETWQKTNPRILRELKVWRLEVIHSNHFELFCS